MCFAVKQKLALLTARKKADEAEKEVLRRIAPAEAAERRRDSSRSTRTQARTAGKQTTATKMKKS